MTEERAREETRKGPFVASEARAAGLVYGYAFDDELEHATQELVGRGLPYWKNGEDTDAPARFLGGGRVALLYLDGEIVDGRSQRIPLLDMRLVGSYSMAEAIDKLRDDATVRAVVLRIESPGGSSLASDVMWRALRLLAQRKPLIVSMGSVAASGGYYVASASRDIYALPLTVTGRSASTMARPISAVSWTRLASPSTRTRPRRAPTRSPCFAATPTKSARSSNAKLGNSTTHSSTVFISVWARARRRSTPLGGGACGRDSKRSNGTSSITLGACAKPSVRRALRQVYPMTPR